jgi:protein gp37
VWTGEVRQARDETFLAPLRWSKPRRIFVNSMGDLFHEDVPDAWIDRVFAVMALAPQHTFQVLTKRAKRMREYCAPIDARRSDALGAAVLALGYRGPLEALRWPLPNVWKGVSAEDQQRADERVPDLIDTPAAVRFVSAEPLLGGIDFNCIPWLKDRPRFPETDDISDGRSALRTIDDSRLNWIIVGGESGPGARPMHPDWARSIRDQCAAAGVAFFFKQHGEFVEFDPTPEIEVVHDGSDRAEAVLSKCAHPSWLTLAGQHITDRANLPEFGQPRARLLDRVGKRAAGRLLDGREHNAFPGEA